ncbi:DUF2726 domain-containing protein [Entomomonas asaccharolytica]|uniref:DUF2726 domain-containing protein n=1 Tax=Entomomonas asaccharolytica TaxID=2785331 RepID=A0A974NE43_9GAMM|nr:DUF2726 domain-containing protein [Entomomonas asaccharolytica]QQP84863.1 DUF2726 domain-containing protein [Entomomonas asaccharolytica]
MHTAQVLQLLLYPALALLVLVAVTIVVVILKKAQAWPYQAVPVMSPIEKKFYWQLKRTFPHYHILAQVHLSQVIRPPRGKNELKWLNKIWYMSLDFVILDDRLEMVAAIELDDRSHLLKRRREADQRKSKALKAAGVRLIRIQTSHLPNDLQLANLLEGDE